MSSIKIRNAKNVLSNMTIDKHEAQDKSLFNNIAKEYFFKDIYPVSAEARKFQLRSLTEVFFKHYKIRNLGVILELGCGVGASASYLKGSFDKYIGIDYSEELIKLATKHFSEANTEFICANIKDVVIDDNKIDFVLGVGVLHHVSDLEEVLTHLRKLGNSDTVYGFIEPQGSNPLVQCLRKMRMLTDKKYSNDQIFFKKNEIIKIFDKSGYEITNIKYQGYFTPPLAQVIMKPKALFFPIVKIFIKLDTVIQNYLNNIFAWNIIWIAKKR